MEWEQVRVSHVRYGEGSVLSCGDGFVKVRFDDSSERSFMYPDAFARFLRTEDTGAAAQAAQDIIMKKATEDAILREQQQAREAMAAAVAAAQKPAKASSRKKTAAK